jgi:HK97 family phage prohead protease
METQYKICDQAQVKLTGSDDGPGEITFYLSTWMPWDRVRPVPERPAKGAFAPYLDEFIKDGWLGESHMWENRPIGTIKDASEDSLGLLVTAEFHATPEAQQARQTAKERMARGKGVSTSMGYTVKADEYVPVDDPLLEAEGVTEGRVLVKVPVFEASLVNRPANPAAVVVGVKGQMGTDWSFAERAQPS